MLSNTSAAMTITTLPVDMQLDGHMRAAATERHRATAEAGGSKIGVKGVYGDCPKLEATKTGYHRQRATYVVKGGPSANFGMPGVEYDVRSRRPDVARVWVTCPPDLLIRAEPVVAATRPLSHTLPSPRAASRAVPHAVSARPPGWL